MILVFIIIKQEHHVCNLQLVRAHRELRDVTDVITTEEFPNLKLSNNRPFILYL